MDYTYFEIRQYKSISSPLMIDLKNETIPIIGINECGKTTILKALFAFDHFNDSLNEGLHLKDVVNLYRPYGETEAKIQAGIKLDQSVFKNLVQDLNNQSPMAFSDECYRNIFEKCPETLIIERVLNGDKKYNIIGDLFENEKKDTIDALAKSVIRELPCIVYFDDFNDSIPQVIEVPLAEAEALVGWAEIVNNVFKKTDKSLTVRKLPDMDENTRKSALADVGKTLCDTITKNWTGKTLDGGTDIERLTFGIEYFQKSNQLIHLSIKVRERLDDKDRFFDVNQRSKGFYWFFNFFMKLSFNPKSEVRDDGQVIFLLDEPGAYLHVSAQKELCKQLATVMPTRGYRVIYCTHSHSLLDPRSIRLPSVKICSKEQSGNVKLFTIYEYAALHKPNMHALEPIYDVLGINENFLEGIKQKVVLVEGITDFYSFHMFNDCDDISFMPFTGTHHINYVVPIFLSAGRRFLCLRDGDDEGQKAQKDLEGIFGQEVQRISMTLSQLDPSIKKIEDVYDTKEIETAKLTLGTDMGNAKKVIPVLFFHPTKDKIIEEMPKTKKKFRELLEKFTAKRKWDNE